LFSFLAAVIALGCIAASARRLYFALTATSLDPSELLNALRGDKGRALFPALVAAIRLEPAAAFERDLVDAVQEHSGTRRVAMVNEQMSELDYMLQRWTRVPRVCASIASSCGFLLASLALRNALADTSDLIDVNGAVTSALNVAATGIAGAAFCVAFQYAARGVAKARMVAADKLVERIETLAS
jgi:hypothetical protein